MSGILNAAREQCGFTVEELWLQYYSLGGTATEAEMRSFLTGEAIPTSPQYDVIAQALNERFVDRDLDHPVPYAEDL